MGDLLILNAKYIRKEREKNKRNVFPQLNTKRENFFFYGRSDGKIYGEYEEKTGKILKLQFSSSISSKWNSVNHFPREFEKISDYIDKNLIFSKFKVIESSWNEKDKKREKWKIISSSIIKSKKWKEEVYKSARNGFMSGIIISAIFGGNFEILALGALNGAIIGVGIKFLLDYFKIKSIIKNA